MYMIMHQNKFMQIIFFLTLKIRTPNMVNQRSMDVLDLCFQIKHYIMEDLSYW